MDRRVVRAVGAAVFAVGLGATGALPAVAAPAPDAGLPAAMASAMQRDLGLSAAEVNTRIAQETRAVTTERNLTRALGDSFAGAWFDEASGRLVVGTTDGTEIGAIQAAGAIPSVQRRSQTQLNSVQTGLDRDAVDATDSVTGWYVDARTNSVVVTATNAAAGREFVRQSGVETGAVRVEQVAERPQTFVAIRGGGAIFAANGGRCSVGFSARNSAGTTFVITAGHCTEIGGTWSATTNGATSGSRVTLGPVSGTSFPNNDYGRITVTNTSAWQGSSQVIGTSSVLGSTQSAIGSSTCRSGSTTGYRCGTVQAFNQTVNYGGGDIVYGLTRTNACAQPGDSGGSFVSGRQAQGMTSGGSGNCSTGGTTFHQPVNEALQAYGLTLVTG